jgi:hypothetical protein
MTDQTDKMITLILKLTCERDDAKTLANELASSLKDVLTFFGDGYKNEYTVKHARDVLAYHMMVSKVRAKESGE